MFVVPVSPVIIIKAEPAAALSRFTFSKIHREEKRPLDTYESILTRKEMEDEGVGGGGVA